MRMIWSSRFLNRRSWSTFLMATSSLVSRHVAWNTTPNEPLPTTRSVEKWRVMRVGPGGRGEGGRGERRHGLNGGETCLAYEKDARVTIRTVTVRHGVTHKDEPEG